MRLKPVEEQVVALMGASSGIGRETARRFAGRGAKVVVAARNKEGLDSLVEEIRGNGGEATAVVADVTDFEQVRAVADRAAEEHGRLDTWVHLSGVSVFAPFWEHTPEEFGRVIEVDLVGQAYGAMAALPHLMLQGRGALVHVSSVVGRRAVPLQSAYSAAKHGVSGMLESLRVELLREGWSSIGVTEVMPAAINTPFFDKARTRLGVKPKGFPPMYEPGVVAGAILYSAEKAPRDIVAGGAGKGMLFAQRLSPRLMDSLMQHGAFGTQMTDEPKGADAPDGLFSPVSDDRASAGFDGQILSRSLTTWLDTHPAAKAGIVAAALGALAALRARS
ncbi:MAG: SDR family oxidoreductase [Actinomycetota bacterium]